MKKNKKDDKIFLKFKEKYKVIFDNQKFISFTQNHFDKKGGMAAFIICLLENQLGEARTISHININKNEWIDLLYDLYNDKSIITVYEELILNPVIAYEEVFKKFDCFNKIVNKIESYFEAEQFDLGIEKLFVKQILKSGFGYILYNCIDCKVYYDFEDILADPEYDQKLIMVLYNTKLFAYVKKQILNCCKDKVNDFITLILGLSQNLYLDK